MNRYFILSCIILHATGTKIVDLTVSTNDGKYVNAESVRNHVAATVGKGPNEKISSTEVIMTNIIEVNEKDFVEWTRKQKEA